MLGCQCNTKSGQTLFKTLQFHVELRNKKLLVLHVYTEKKKNSDISDIGVGS